LKTLVYICWAIESAWSPSVHQGSVVGLIEPLRGGGSGSVLSMTDKYISAVEQRKWFSIII